MNLLSAIHKRLLGQYRLNSLICQIAEVIPQGTTVLDLGCGNGHLAAEILAIRPDIHVEGVDLHSVSDAKIRIHYYDGETIPFPDHSWDVCMANDVIHHCENPTATIKEMCRVSKSTIILKDHLANSQLDTQLLRLMDWIGNKGYGTPLPYNFLSTEEWDAIFEQLGLQPTSYTVDLELYPPLFMGTLDRKMHFLAALIFIDRC